MALRKDSQQSRKRILSACVKLFIEKGYKDTKMSDIISEAKVSNSTFQNIFHSKNGVLMDLVEFMFDKQFQAANQISDIKPIYIYAVETSIQITITELNENLREIYLEAYDYQQTKEYIYKKTACELHKIFGSYLPYCSESDFYELEIGTSGIMRSYMAKKCNMYFTLDKKIMRFLTMSMNAYSVPIDEQEQVLQYIENMNIKDIANKVMYSLFQELAMEFHFEFDDEYINKAEVFV